MVPDDAGRVPVRRALLSVSDPAHLLELAKGLAGHQVELWATGGTRATLEAGEIRSHPAEELTGIGSWFGGRIKTLHPGILAGVLAPRTPEGLAELERRHLSAIDLVVCNLYPFERRYAEAPDAPDLEESIDIGGVTLLRSAAKNHAYVAVLSDPTQYAAFLAEFEANRGGTTAAHRRQLAAAAFARVQAYDRVIARALAGRDAPPEEFPDAFTFERAPERLRYGENPHQRAAVYLLRAPAGAPFPAPPVERLQGEPLSYTNLLDLDTVLGIVAEFPTPAAAVVKHATPIGVASAASLAEALASALATDPVARYGCAVAVNRPLSAPDAAALHGVFVDLLAAPEIEPAARGALAGRAKLKLLRTAPPPIDRPRWEAKSALGRLLVQETDRRELAAGEMKPVTTRRAGSEELAALGFAWRVVRHAKSNAVVLARGSSTVGIGAGQPTRVKAVELAVEVAGPRARGAVLASDAFFPFADGIEAAGKAGVSAIVQPGGSLRDPEVVAAAERFGIAMYTTGWRVFRH